MIKRILKFLGGIILIGFLLALYFYFQFQPAEKVNFGITFSRPFAASLGFDPNQVYIDMLDDLKPEKIRLMTYWNEIEKIQGKYDFQNIDYMLDEAGKRNVGVVLVVGKKQPRWPECHIPDWYKALDESKKEQATLTMIKTTVEHFKLFEAIKAWQVENEPFFVFGIDCPKQSLEMVAKEINMVKSLDSRPVIITESGEQGNWNRTMKAGGDILGATMYRLVHNDRFGYYRYPVGPWFYRIKAGVLKKYTGKQVIGVELQAEPWVLSGILNTDLDTQRSLMNPQIFQDHVEYAKKVGFADNYLWGVEWWYWMAKTNNDWGMWGAAKDLLKDRE